MWPCPDAVSEYGPCRVCRLVRSTPTANAVDMVLRHPPLLSQVPAPKQQMIAKQDWKYVSKASQVARAAHEAQSEITCLAFSQDSTSLLSRGMDGSMKLWDLRKLSQPVDCYTGEPQACICVRVVVVVVVGGASQATFPADGPCSRKVHMHHCSCLLWHRLCWGRTCWYHLLVSCCSRCH